MKILHADDHSLFREGLQFFLKLLDKQVVVLEASNIQAALDKLALESPVDLMVLDLQMPGMSELDGFFAIRRRHPDLPIVVVSGVNDARTIRALIDGGARGYIPKLASSEQLMEALRRVLHGEIYLPDALFLPESQASAAADDKGTLTSFVVRESRKYNVAADATAVFISNDGKAHLNLITCNGAWDARAKTYTKRLVVFADKVE